MNHRNLALGLSALLCTSSLLIGLASLLHVTHSTLIMGVLVWAGSESLLAFYGLTWGLTRSNKAFFSMFAGGALLRLLSIGIVAYIVTVLRVPPAAPLLSLIGAYFILSLVQLPFITHEFR